jgi:hypothetical protein
MTTEKKVPVRELFDRNSRSYPDTGKDYRETNVSNTYSPMAFGGDTAEAAPQRLADAGLRKTFEVGIALAPCGPAATVAAKALAAFLDEHRSTPVRLVGLAVHGSRVTITVAVSLGTVDDLKAGSANSRAALAAIQDLIDHLGAYDPAITALPDPNTAEAELAHVVRTSREHTLDSVVGQLAATA